MATAIAGSSTVDIMGLAAGENRRAIGYSRPAQLRVQTTTLSNLLAQLRPPAIGLELPRPAADGEMSIAARQCMARPE